MIDQRNHYAAKLAYEIDSWDLKVSLEAAEPMIVIDARSPEAYAQERRETIKLIKKSMPQAEAEATLEKLQRRENSDDAARELIDIYADQHRDSRRNKVRQDA